MLITTAKDCKEAGNIVNTFLNNESETFLMLMLDSEYVNKEGYTIVKLPYTENIVFLYGIKPYNGVLSPHTDLKYIGFYHFGTKQAYDIRDPFECFFRFEHTFIYEGTLRTMVKEAVQRATAERIASNAEEEFKGISVTVSDSDIRSDAETAFSKNESVLDFAKKISINEWYISQKDLVDFIDDREKFLTDKAENRIKDNREELARMWKAHCTSQKLLNLLNAEDAKTVQ